MDQNIKSGISHQPILGSYSNFKLMLSWPNNIFEILKMKMTSNGRRPQDILRDYHSNHLGSDHTQILNLSLDHHTIFYKSWKWKITSKRLECDSWVLRGK